MGKLDGKIAVVTGGSRGIGSGICKELALEGATIAVNYSEHLAEAERVVATIRQLGGTAEFFHADVGIKSDVDRMMAQIVSHFGGIDILVNNAGICPFREFFDIEEDIWQRTLDVNLSGMFYCSQAAGKSMKEKGKGAIVNISTTTSLRGGKQQVHYASSKGGINSMTTSMATALGTHGIRVNAILCGGVSTDINFEQRDNGRINSIPKQKDPRLPAGRIGDPEDLGKAVVFLVSDDSEWISGVQLVVDGGELIS